MPQKIVIELTDEGQLNVRWSKEIENPVTLRGLLAIASDTVKEYFEKGAKTEIIRPKAADLPPIRFPGKPDGFDPFAKNGG